MKKRVLALIIMSALTAVCLSGCLRGAQAESGKDSEEPDTIEIWISESVKTDTQKQVQDFMETNPDMDHYDIIIKSVGEDDAADAILMNTDDCPDLYGFAQDQLARLVSEETISPLNQEDAAWVRDQNDTGSVAASSIDDTLYAYPLTSDNGYFLYYDKSLITDPGSLETILADCEKAGKDFCMEISNGWYQTSFFFATGCRLKYHTDSKGNFTASTVTYASPEGLTAIKELIQVSGSKAFKDTCSPSKAANSAAIVDGTWNSEEYKKLYGANYACAKLPSFESEGTTYQMSGFGGFKLLGTRPQHDQTKLAVCQALARYLSGKEAQLARFRSRGWGPSNKEAQNDDSVRSDPALSALNAQLPYMIPQGQYPYNYWIVSKTLGQAIIAGEYDKADDKELMEVLQNFQRTCESYAR